MAAKQPTKSRLPLEVGLLRSRGMGRLVCVVAAAALLCGPIGSARVFACTCETGFAFAAYAASDEVFTGRIVAIARDPTSEFQRLIVRVRVAESMKGSAAGEVEVISGSICGFPFERGGDYLIYATYEADGLNVYLCNRTRTLSLARVDLSYIVGVSKGRSGANVYGWVDRERANGQPAIREEIRLRMVLSGTGGRFETLLEDGKFEFHFVPPGTYTLSAIGAEVMTIMSSRSRGVVLRGVTIDESTDEFSMAVTLRIN
jgi:hypothetical protein